MFFGTCLAMGQVRNELLLEVSLPFKRLSDAHETRIINKIISLVTKNFTHKLQRKNTFMITWKLALCHLNREPLNLVFYSW